MPSALCLPLKNQNHGKASFRPVFSTSELAYAQKTVDITIERRLLGLASEIAFNALNLFMGITFCLLPTQCLATLPPTGRASPNVLLPSQGPSLWNPGTPMMPGAVLASIFWAILSALFRFYVEKFGNYNKVYGAVGAVIVLMLWLWMSAAVLLVGDQLNVIVGEDMRSPAASKKN